MDAEKTKFENVLAHIKDYLNTRYDLAILGLSDKCSTLLSGIISIVIVTLIGLFFLLFLSIAIALLISKYIGSFYLGFFIVAAFYLLVALAVWAFKDKLVKMPLLNFFIKQFCMEDNCDA